MVTQTEIHMRKHTSEVTWCSSEECHVAQKTKFQWWGKGNECVSVFVCHELCFSLPQYICSDLCEMLKSSLLLSLKTDLNSIHITAFHSTVCISKCSSLFSSSDHSNVHPVPLSLNGNGQLHALPTSSARKSDKRNMTAGKSADPDRCMTLSFVHMLKKSYVWNLASVVNQ